MASFIFVIAHFFSTASLEKCLETTTNTAQASDFIIYNLTKGVPLKTHYKVATTEGDGI